MVLDHRRKIVKQDPRTRVCVKEHKLKKIQAKLHFLCLQAVQANALALSAKSALRKALAFISWVFVY